jgi:hypothetical protein
MKAKELYLEGDRIRNEKRYLVVKARKSKELYKRRLAFQRIKSLTRFLIKIKRTLRLKNKVRNLIRKVKENREKRSATLLSSTMKIQLF